MGIRDGPHHRTDSQAVEVIIDKDQNTQCRSGQLGANPGLNTAGGPFAEGGRSAGTVHHRHQRSQHHQKNQDSHVSRVRQLTDHSSLLIEEEGVEHKFHIEVGVEEGACENPQHQRGVDLLGDQSQGNGDHRRQQGQGTGIYRADIALQRCHIHRMHKARYNEHHKDHQKNGYWYFLIHTTPFLLCLLLLALFRDIMRRS